MAGGSGDKRSVFAEAYSQMTAAMLSEIRAGRFRDPVWVSDLLDAFADYYFDAVTAFETSDPISESWRLAMGAAARDDLSVLHHLFLGINAHINRDLIFTVTDLFQRVGGPTDQQREDFDRVNEVIGETIDIVQRDVIAKRSAIWGFVDAALGPFDEWLIVELIENWRTDVWSAAIGWWAAPEDEKGSLRNRVEDEASRRAEAILRLG